MVVFLGLKDRRRGNNTIGNAHTANKYRRLAEYFLLPLIYLNLAGTLLLPLYFSDLNKQSPVMKKSMTYVLLLFGGLLLLPAFTAEGGGKVKIPKKINSIIQAKCYGCHNTESKNKRPKDKLNWDELTSMPADQQAEKLADIQKVLEKGSMPPDRFLEKQPDMKLTDKETANMKKWAAKMGKRVSK